MLFLVSFAIGADLTTYDPASWVTWGMAPSTARELADPVTTPKVAPSGMLNIGFGSEDVGGGGLYRGGMTRVFLGVDGGAARNETTAEDEFTRSLTTSWAVPVQLAALTRIGPTGLSLSVSGVSYASTIGDDPDSGLTTVYTDTRGGDGEPGALRGGDFDARVLAEWGREIDDVRPRFGVLLVGRVSSASLEYTSAADPGQSWTGDPAVWLNFAGTEPWDNRWEAGTGIRGALDVGGTNAEPRTHGWAEVLGRGGGVVVTESTHVEGDTTESVSSEDAYLWDIAVEFGLNRRFGGPDAAIWIGGVGTLGFDRVREARITTADGVAVDWERTSEAGKRGTLSLRAAGFADLAPPFRLWAGIEPTVSWSTRTDDNLDTDTALDADWNGRLAMQWHHPRGFFAAMAWGMSESGAATSVTSVASLIGSSTSLWIGWVPE